MQMPSEHLSQHQRRAAKVRQHLVVQLFDRVALCLHGHADGTEPSPWTAGFQYLEHGSVPRLVKAAGGGFWSVYHGDVDAAKVKEARSLGLKVLVWTVNDAATMNRVLDLGIDGLITDHPDIARKVLAGRGIEPR